MSVRVVLSNTHTFFSERGPFPENAKHPFFHVYLTRDLDPFGKGSFQKMGDGKNEFVFRTDGEIVYGHSGVRIDLYAHSQNEQGHDFFKYCGSHIHHFQSLPSAKDFSQEIDLIDKHPDFGKTFVTKGQLVLSVSHSVKGGEVYVKPPVIGELDYLIDKFDRVAFEPRKWVHPIVGAMHCVRNMTAVTMMPYYSFLWNTTPCPSSDEYFQTMANLALRLQGLDADTFCEHWESQTNLDAVTGAAVMMISFFSYSVPYIPDHAYNRRGKCLDDEEFTDSRLCGGGDCEDMARAIVMCYFDFLSRKRPGKVLGTMRDILSHYTPSLAVVSAKSYSASVNSKSDDAQSSTDFACHCIGFLIPNDVASQYTQIPSDAPQKHGLPVHCLEGTTPMQSVCKPIWEIYGGKAGAWKDMQTFQIKSQIPFTSKVFPTDEKAPYHHPFYCYVHDLFFPRSETRRTYACIPYNTRTKEYGAIIHDFMNNPYEHSGTPVITLSDDEFKRMDCLMWAEPPTMDVKLPSYTPQYKSIIAPSTPHVEYWVSRGELEKFSTYIPSDMQPSIIDAPVGRDMLVVRLYKK